MRCWDARFRLRRVWSLELPAELLMLRVSKFGIWVEIVFSEFALTCPTSFLASQLSILGLPKLVQDLTEEVARCEVLGAI